MKVKVLFFGATADATGTRFSELELPSGSKSADAFDRVAADHRGLAGHRLLYSVNQEYATGDELLNDGDELAVFTAVSGG